MATDYPSNVPMGAIFSTFVRKIAPSFSDRLERRDKSGIEAKIEISHDAVFNVYGLTLAVIIPDGGKGRLVRVKETLSGLLIERTGRDGVADLVSVTLRNLFYRIAPHLYELDYRKGDLYCVGQTLQEDILFDPPGQSPVRLDRVHCCAVCGNGFAENIALWGGGNLGWIHPACGAELGVYLSRV